MLKRGRNTGRPDAAIRGFGKRLAVGLAAASLLVAGLGTTGTAAASPDADPGVIRDWNATAVATIVVDAGKANAEAFLWYGYVQAPVYNAVVGITRDYELYRWRDLGPRSASPEAAAAQAAHDVLLHYFPASQARLDTQLATSLAGITDGDAEDQGVAYGAASAAHFIEQRADDGVNAPITFDQAPAKGVWRPTPPTNTPFLVPWLSQVEPLMMTSSKQFRPGPPPALTSARYTADFNEVKAVGAKTGSTRTPEQTETAMFTTDIAIGSYQAALRDLTARRAMDISDTARLFAAVDMSLTDSIIAVWDSKYHYGYWRPITAIQLADTDGNPDTVVDAAWEPLVATPPYPDYVSGFNGITGALTRSVSRILGLGHGGRVDLNITSAAAGVTRHYRFASALNRDGINGRVWLGIHFRTADEVAIQMSTRVANWGMNHYFQPA